MALVNDAENAYVQQNLLVANAAGNVGIGAATPLDRFHVESGVNDMGLFIRNSLTSANATNRISFANGAATATAIIESVKPSSSSVATDLKFWVHDGASWNYPLYLKNNGNVGIGMTPSNYKLDVNGEINATGLRINGTPIGTGGGSGPWATGTSSIYYSTNNVGIGTNNPGARLDVLSAYGAAIRALSGNTAAHTSIQIGRVVTEGTLAIAGNNGDYAVGSLAGEVILRTEDAGKKLLFANGPSAPTMAVHNSGVGVTGNMNVTGTITGGVIEAKYQDVAEWVESSQKLEAGTVVALDPEKSNQVLASAEAYDTKVAGVISAQPGISLGERGEGKVLVATTGRVKVKVDATRAPIKIGDLLVTSDVQGVAMKSEPISVGGRRMHVPGTLIGKALEPLASGTGVILVLLSLQ
jgi:hypothetical protein